MMLILILTGMVTTSHMRGATPAVLNNRESREKPEDKAYNVYQNIDLTNTHRAIHVADLRHPPHDAKRLPHVQ